MLVNSPVRSIPDPFASRSASSGVAPKNASPLGVPGMGTRFQSALRLCCKAAVGLVLSVQ